ncbi:MAG: hypothetical protein ABIF10_04740, partial [Candidatus Woesearchaeota archaeon]
MEDATEGFAQSKGRIPEFLLKTVLFCTLIGGAGLAAGPFYDLLGHNMKQYKQRVKDTIFDAISARRIGASRNAYVMVKNPENTIDLYQLPTGEWWKPLKGQCLDGLLQDYMGVEGRANLRKARQEFLRLNKGKRGILEDKVLVDYNG